VHSGSRWLASLRRRGVEALFCLAVLSGLPPVSRADTPDGLIAASGIKGGLVVVVGNLQEPALEELVPGPSFLVQGLLRDESAAVDLRTRIHAAGRGDRVAVRTWDGKRLPYIDKLVNVLVMASGDSALAVGEIERVLAPNGVVMTREKSTVLPASFEVRSSAPEGWRMASKPWPEGMGEWNHWLHGPDNTGVTTDEISEFPRELQWHQIPLWLKSHELIPALSAVVSAQGRVFYIIDECAETAASVAAMPEKWKLVAVDGFNGIELWSKPIKEWGTQYWMPEIPENKRPYPFVTRSLGGRSSEPPGVLRRLVAVDNKVFVTLGLFAPVTALDAATGGVIRQYAGTEKAFEILCRDDTLYIARNKGLGPDGARDEKPVTIMAVKVTAGECLWESESYAAISGGGFGDSREFRACTLTLGDQHVYFQDETGIVALDLKTGEEAWTSPQEGLGALCALAYSSGRVLLTYKSGGYPKSGWDKHASQAVLIALDAASGKESWRAESASMAMGTPPDLFINDGLAWMLAPDSARHVGLDVQTGAQRKTIDASVIAKGTHHNCYQNKASRNFIFYGRNKGVECFDVNSGEVSVNKWVKGACSYGIMPANGMLYAPSHMCGCKMTAKLNGIVALTTASLGGKALSDVSAVTKGPAFGRAFDPVASAAAGDWPIYRGNTRREGFQPMALAGELKEGWQTALGGKLTPPIIAGDKVFVAGKDTHIVYALDRGTGETVWSFVASGYIDSAPTWHAGRVVFGGRDGFVYCLDAADGQLVWRFRAAPDETQVQAFGRLESAWPVSGSLVVSDGKVFVPAGRSTSLDSGIALYMLDLATGNPLKSRWIDDDVNEDILIANEGKAQMRSSTICMETLDGQLQGPEKKEARDEELITVGAGMLDDSNFMIAYWELNGFGGSIIATDKDAVYGIHYYGGYTPLGYKSDAKPNYFPGLKKTILFKGCEEAVMRPNGQERVMPVKKWAAQLPILGKALVVGADRVCVAGVPDIVEHDSDDPWAYFDGRKGGKLLVYAKADGSLKQELSLASPPVWDGIALAHGAAFVSCRDGSVVAFCATTKNAQ
jgi:outer membrane protein assembly factor BamB